LWLIRQSEASVLLVGFELQLSRHLLLWEAALLSRWSIDLHCTDTAYHC
jgi:hypothetical protein